MPLRRSLAAALMVIGLVTTGAPRAAETAPPCQPSRGALVFLGCSLAEKLGPAARDADVVVVDLKSDRDLTSADAVRERVQSAVLLALRPASDVAKPDRKKLRVELALDKRGGVLRVTADLRRAMGLWQRVRQEKPRAEAHAFVEVPLDAELRALIPPPPLVVSETLVVPAPERGIVALACGPLAGEGGQELLLVSRSHVRIGRVVGRKFVERASAGWSTLSPVSAAPLREPITSAEITPQGMLRVGSSDRRDGVELGPDLTVRQRFPSRLPMAGGCLARNALGMTAKLLPCTGNGEGDGTAVTLDALAGSSAGWVGRELQSGRLILGGASSAAPLATPVGAQLAVGDPDSDGAAEVAYSLDTRDPSKDRVTLVTLTPHPIKRFELAVPGVSAIAICQRREGPGMAPLVVATNNELWLLR